MNDSSASLLSNTRFVLINPTHPGNIGAVARAMKNMGLSKLYLVNPLKFPDPDAIARASGADDILQAAVIVDDLDMALTDCSLVIGTSSRSRALPWPLLNLRQAAQQILQESSEKQIAILFGQERIGLSNDELQRCHYLIHIPCNPDFPSLNIAAAAQVIAYEIRIAMETEIALAPDTTDYATAEEMENFYQHLQQVLINTKFLDPNNPRQLMRRLYRLFNRSRLEKNEVNILRGILTAVDKKQ